MENARHEQHRTAQQLIREQRSRLAELVEAGEDAPPGAIRAALDRLQALEELAKSSAPRRRNLVPAVLFVVSAVVILVLAVVPVRQTAVEIQVDTEYFRAHVPGSMSGYGENLGKCTPAYYAGGLQLWPVRSAVGVHVRAATTVSSGRAPDLTLSDRAAFSATTFSRSTEFWLRRANAEPFAIDIWGVAGDTDLVVRRIPTESALTLQFAERPKEGADWWVPCIGFAALDDDPAERSDGGWSIGRPRDRADVSSSETLAAAVAAAIASASDRVTESVDAAGLYASSSGPEVTVEVELADSGSQPIYSGKQVSIDDLKLGPWEEGAPDGCADQEFKPIRGGTVRLLDFDRVIQLYASDCLDITWDELFLMGVDTSRDGVQLRVRGLVSELSVFTTSASNQIPSYLEWLYAQEALAVVWGAILYLAGLGVALYRWVGEAR